MAALHPLGPGPLSCGEALLVSEARPPAPSPALRATGCRINLPKRQTEGEPKCVHVALQPPVLPGLSSALK